MSRSDQPPLTPRAAAGAQARDKRDSGGKRDASVREIPDGPPDATGLTPRQRRVLEVIRDSVERRGYPPSMREIGEAVGLTSTSSVAHQLPTLGGGGVLRRAPTPPPPRRGKVAAPAPRQ